MRWFRKRQQVSLSYLFHGLTTTLLKETNSKFIHSYWPALGDDLAEPFALNSEPFITYLVKCYISDLIHSGGIRTLGDSEYGESEIMAAWQSGLQNTLQQRARSSDDYEARMHLCLTAQVEYESVYLSDAANPSLPPSDRYFSATRRLADLITPVNASDRQLVFSTITDMAVTVMGCCKSVAKQFELCGL